MISGVTVSFAPAGNGINVNGASATQVGNIIVTLSSGIVATPAAATRLVVGSQKLIEGGSAITIGGTTYTASGSVVVAVANGQSSTFLMPTPAAQTAALDLLIGSRTLSPGGTALTVSGTTYSAYGSKVVAVADGQTSSFTILTSAPLLGLGSQTLVPGGHAVILSGTTYSISGTKVFVQVSGYSTTIDLGLIAATAAPSNYQIEALDSITQAVENETTVSRPETSRSEATRTSSSNDNRSSRTIDPPASASNTSEGSRSEVEYLVAAVVLLHAFVR